MQVLFFADVEEQEPSVLFGRVWFWACGETMILSTVSTDGPDSVRLEKGVVRIKHVEH